MPSGCDTLRVELTPAQDAVLQLLRAVDAPRPEVDPSLRDELRRRLETELAPAGEFYYACLMPGHFDAGMIGTIVVR